MTKLKERISLFIKGLCMGTADLVPGISGGTIALIVGIYPKLIHSLSTINFSFIWDFLKGRWQQAFSNLRKINFAFFIPLGLGILLAILSLSQLMNYLLENYAAHTFAFFFGLILASAVYLTKKLGKIHLEHLIFLGLGFVLAYIISGASAFAAGHSLPVIFIAGMIAISAMILPGISGAFILVLLNQYEFIIQSLHEKTISVIITFIAGALLGLLLFSRVLDYIFRKFRTITIAFLIGVMLGSLRAPFLKITATPNSLSLVFLWGIIGFFMVLVLEFLSKKYT